MGKAIRSVFLALAAVMALGAIMASGAWALPEAENETKTKGTINFDAHSGQTTFRAESFGVIGSLGCEKDLILGGAFEVPGMLATKFVVHLSGKCELKISGTNTACTEPILTHSLLGILGYVSGTSGTVALLVKPESGEEVGSATCGANKVNIDGEVVGEIPRLTKTGVEQYNKILSSIELRFARVAGKETEQAIRTFELLAGFPAPLKMTGVSLSVSGFFGGQASLEATETVLPAALIRISSA